MLSRIVVGVDEHDGGKDALALAEALAGEHAELVLVNAFPYEEHPSLGSASGYAELLRTDSEELLRKTAGDRSELALKPVAGLVPSRALHHVAWEEGADLIVVGSTHHGSIGRLLVGDVARATLHGAPCAVAVAPRGWHESSQPIVTIGVGVDDSAGASLAVEWADALAGRLGSALRLRSCAFVSVFNSDVYGPGFSSFESEHHEALQRHVDQQRERVGASTTAEVVIGHPHRQLAALSEQVDLLVIGSRGWGRLRRVFAGSTGDYLAHHAHCPLVVTPRPDVD